MSNITEFIKYELYPTIFEQADSVFTEHNFKKFYGGWRSNTYLSGNSHKRGDKTVITKRNPGCILEQGGDTKSLVDYVMDRDNIPFIEAVKLLAERVGLRLPEGDFDSDKYQRHREQSTIYEIANGYFVYCLDNSTGAKKIREYLISRGYTKTDIKEMELGYIPSQQNLKNYLSDKGYNHEQINQAIRLNPGIGNTHQLTIPYRSGGDIKGFKFRTVDQDTPKYLNSTGLDRLGGFFNLSGFKGDKDVVIVEGELDSLHATIKGIDNVVATGGDSIGDSQIIDAIRRGAKSFTICLDTEPGKETETAKKIIKASNTIRRAGIDRVYIATLPALGGNKTDPDRLIKETGVEALKEVLSSRLTWGAWYGKRLLESYISKANESGEIDYKDRDLLREKVVKIRSTLSASDRIDFNRHLVEPLRDQGFSEDVLTNLEESHKIAVAEAEKNNRIRLLLAEAGANPDKSKALEDIKEGIKQIDAITGGQLIPPLQDFKSLLTQIANVPPAYSTGYKSLDEFVGFTPGAITLIAGRPSHGKTTFMFNLLLQMSSLHPDQRFYFFSYEEPLRNISIKLLNRLTDTDLSGYYRQIPDLTRPSNYEFIKAYIKAGRTDILQIEQGKERLRELIDSQRITVIDRSYSVEDLDKVITYINKTENVGAVFIDYIQRMNTQRRTQDKRTEVAHISDYILQTAKTSGLPIILGAQLNRDSNNKPKLENLKEAGNLEEDANTVLSVYCEAREKEETETGERYSFKQNVDLEIRTLKNREGEVNRAETLSWDRYTGVITDQPKPEIKSRF